MIAYRDNPSNTSLADGRRQTSSARGGRHLPHQASANPMHEQREASSSSAAAAGAPRRRARRDAPRQRVTLMRLNLRRGSVTRSIRPRAVPSASSLGALPDEAGKPLKERYFLAARQEHNWTRESAPSSEPVQDLLRAVTCTSRPPLARLTELNIGVHQARGIPTLSSSPTTRGNGRAKPRRRLRALPVAHQELSKVDTSSPSSERARSERRLALGSGRLHMASRREDLLRKGSM